MAITPESEPATTGDNPEMFQVTICLSNYEQKVAFIDWINSGDCSRKFWFWWANKYGRYL